MTVPTHAGHDARNTVADELRDIWSELLVLESVEDQQNFVALGGDSIAAAICTMRINTVFGVELDTSVLLQDDADFASLVREVEAQLAGAA